MSEQQNQSNKIDSIKSRLSNPVLELQKAALKEALNFGDRNYEHLYANWSSSKPIAINNVNFLLRYPMY